MRKKKAMFEGSMVALVTPFRNGKVDEKALKGLLDFHLKEGTDVIVPCGTTGESATMSHEEHRNTMTFVRLNHRTNGTAGNNRLSRRPRPKGNP